MQEILTQYKQRFASELWPNERYKWEAVKWFQDHWDVGAEDFPGMLKLSLEKAKSLLLSQNHFPAGMIHEFAENEPEEVRGMFLNLYDESKDLWERVDSFKEKSRALLKRDPRHPANHFQDENAISTYLWLRYPDQYFIYKFAIASETAKTLESDCVFKSGRYLDNIRNHQILYGEICEFLQKDPDLHKLLDENLAANCYSDPSLHTMTVDVCFFIGRYLKDEKYDWWPKDYNPEITAEQWKQLLSDPMIFDEKSLTIVRRFLDYGGEASCSALAEKYGENSNFYKGGASALARKVAEKTNCELLKEGNENAQWWPVMFQGRYAKPEEKGAYIWKLRNELKEALLTMNLMGKSELTPVFWKISHGTSPITDTEFNCFLERNVIVVDKSTHGQGKSKSSQGEQFASQMKAGDYFFLCRGNSIRLLGRLVNNLVESNPEKQSTWLERQYTVVAVSQDINSYTGPDKWWAPSHNSTCVPVPQSDISQFEAVILKPYFGITATSLFTNEFPAVNTEFYTKEDFLREVFMLESKYDRLKSVLEKKKNIILQGAPGVGKTFAARRLAWSIMGKKDDDRVEFVQFHQNYSYEDFVMGYKPVEDGFELRNGIFYRFCQKAASDPKQNYFFIIDEINRGNLSKIFGELLMLIEADYRGQSATLAYNGQSFSVPKNLYLIGMMNTADRSLAMIDYALRRRFSFFDIEPGFDSEGFRAYQKALENETFNTLIERVKELNLDIAQDKSLGKGFCIGHSYFCGAEVCTEEWMQDIVDFDILPMLSEYWFDDNNKLQHWENILRGIFQ